jgi:hypothetical protein
MKRIIRETAWWSALVVMTVINILGGWVLSMEGYPVLGTCAVVGGILVSAWAAHTKIHAGEDERP